MRFRVGAAGAALGMPVDLLRDLAVPLEDVWGSPGRRLSSRVAAAPTAEAALAVLIRGLAEPRTSVDLLAREAARRSTRRPFGTVSTELGMSERQLRRRVERAVGYGPRTLVRVLRLQRFLRLAACEPGAPLMRLAAEAGYADQAHLGRECLSLTGRTPTALRAAGATAAGEPASGTF